MGSRKEERFIIEDDYDSEFRYFGKPIPAIQGLYSRGEKVIYISTFSKSIFPSCRVAYMVLPFSIMKNITPKITLKVILYQFICKTLATFISTGSFERHLNKMRGFIVEN